MKELCVDFLKSARCRLTILLLHPDCSNMSRELQRSALGQGVEQPCESERPFRSKAIQRFLSDASLYDHLLLKTGHHAHVVISILICLIKHDV